MQNERVTRPSRPKPGWVYETPFKIGIAAATLLPTIAMHGILKPMKQETSPLIIGFVSDLMFTAKIENVARHLGFRLEWFDDSQPGLAEPPHEGPGEQLYGRAGQLFRQITRKQPALLLFDLNNQAVPWAKWIAALKSAAATRRIPILCFGPHADTAVMTRAKQAGADGVLARSRFTAAMPALFEKYARIPDQNVLADACRQPLSDLAKRGIRLFNEGKYYQCHDDLEAAWRQDQTPGRDLYRAILQIGITLYQIEKGNHRAAVKMLMRVRQWLAPLPTVCRGIDVALLRRLVDDVDTAVQALAPDQLQNFNWSLIPPIPLPD